VGLAESGTEVGSVTYTFGESTVTVPLTLDSDISDPGPWWRLLNPAALL
jgi:D-alanyl-D-alanine carboxypeptidase (penicillin-binding protein 5/6)